jgi:hypothetical protein
MNNRGLEYSRKQPCYVSVLRSYIFAILYEAIESYVYVYEAELRQGVEYTKTIEHLPDIGKQYLWDFKNWSYKVIS